MEVKPASLALPSDTLDRWSPGSLTVATADGRIRVQMGGVIQPRFQFLDDPHGEGTNSFLMRRVRLDLRGSVLDERLIFQILPEFAGSGASVLDAWVEVRLAESARLRAGQFVVPFHWQRYVSAARQHLAERAPVSGEFGFAGAWDTGVALFGTNRGGSVAYGAGVFDGAGRNVGVGTSPGLMGSGRITWAVLGPLPREEPDLARSEALGLSLGGALQGAHRNEVRAWDLGRSAVGNGRADWRTATVDASLRRMGASVAGSAFLRRVDPADPGVESYTGRGYMVSAGYFVFPRHVELVARHSRLRLDTDDAGTRDREWGTGLNLYHAGHDLKTHLHYWNRHRFEGTQHLAVVQIQFLF
jgi:phosphate-selective porin OprO and OprP